MTDSSAIAIYNSHTEAEAAIKELQQSGFDMKKLSIVGKDYETQENVVGYYNTGERMATWGTFGAFWGWAWGLIFGSAFLLIPGLGPVMIGGPILTSILAALETALVVGGLSAFGAALVGIGIPKDSVVRYETALKANKFMLIAHGTPAEVDKAKSIIDTHKPESSEVHHELTSNVTKA